MTRHLSTLVAATLILALGACTEQKIYRPNTELCTSTEPDDDWTARCQESAVQAFDSPDFKNQAYFLGFIEFDDQGQLWQRDQMSKVIDEIYHQSGDEDVLMVVFVHGWKHNASPGDNNITHFRGILRRVSEIESLYAGDKARKVFGIYLGWRGASVTMPGIKQLTFWDRKATAENVGRGAVAEVLARLELLRQTKNSLGARKGMAGRTRLVIVGHSFGGALVYSSLAQLLEERFILGIGVDKNYISDTRGFGDLVVLVNPAFEANLYAPLSDMSTERATYFPTQRPVIAILTSEADDATRLLFPIGRSFNTAFEFHRVVERYNPILGRAEAIDQREADITTVGHFGPYRTHTLRPSSAEAASLNLTAASELASLARTQGAWQYDKPESRIPFPGLVLQRTANSAGRNPYLVVQVDKSLISGHNEIYDPRIMAFIRQLIFLSVE